MRYYTSATILTVSSLAPLAFRFNSIHIRGDRSSGQQHRQSANCSVHSIGAGACTEHLHLESGMWSGKGHHGVGGCLGQISVVATQGQQFTAPGTEWCMLVQGDV